MAPDWLDRATAIAEELVGGRLRPRIAVIHGQRGGEIQTSLSDRLPGAAIRCHDAAARIEELHVALAAHGPYDLLIDLAAGTTAARRFRKLFFHAAVGGFVVFRRAVADRDDLVPYIESAKELGGAALPPDEPFDERPRGEADLHALATSMDEIRILPRFVIVQNGVATLAKIPERLADDFVSLTDSASSTLTTIPPAAWESPCVARGSDPGRVAELPRVLEGGPLSIREHCDVVCGAHGAVYRDNVALPDSYRRRKNRLRSAAFVDWAHWFARKPDAEPTPLPGRYFHLDNEWRGHFGHLMVEQVSKLWAWERAKRDDPGLKVLLTANEHRPMREWEYVLLAAGGVPRDDIVVAQGPVRVERLVTGSPAYNTPEGLHPVLGESYRRMGAALDRGEETGGWAPRVFLTRRRTHPRYCHNAEEVEDLMTQAGFRVVHPEDHPVPDQVTMVRRAEVVAGFSGSGMFTIALAGSPKHVIAIGSEAYTANNEYRLSSFLGHRLDLVWCQAEVPRGTPGRGVAFRADFTFDRDREGRFLREVLDEL